MNRVCKNPEIKCKEANIKFKTSYSGVHNEEEPCLQNH